MWGCGGVDGLLEWEGEGLGCWGLRLSRPFVMGVSWSDGDVDFTVFSSRVLFQYEIDPSTTVFQL